MKKLEENKSLKKFDESKIELKGLIRGGLWLYTNAGCSDTDIEDTETCEVVYL